MVVVAWWRLYDAPKTSAMLSLAAKSSAILSLATLRPAQCYLWQASQLWYPRGKKIAKFMKSPGKLGVLINIRTVNLIYYRII